MRQRQPTCEAARARARALVQSSQARLPAWSQIAVSPVQIENLCEKIFATITYDSDLKICWELRLRLLAVFLEGLISCCVSLCNWNRTLSATCSELSFSVAAQGEFQNFIRMFPLELPGTPGAKRTSRLRWPATRKAGRSARMEPDSFSYQ